MRPPNSDLRLVLEGKSDKKIPESSRLEFSEKFLANYASSDAEDKSPGRCIEEV